MFPTIESYLFDDPNNPNQNVVVRDPNLVENNSGGEDDNSNKPKCSKCSINDAIHQLTIQVTNTQNSETHLLCDACYQDFIKCQECKNQEVTIATLKNNQKIYVCSECNQKLKAQTKIKETKKTNWPLIAGISLIAVGIIGGLGYYFWNKRKAKKES